MGDIHRLGPCITTCDPHIVLGLILAFNMITSMATICSCHLSVMSEDVYPSVKELCAYSGVTMAT